LKTSLGATEHRLETYATLVFRTNERSLRNILEALAVSQRWRRMDQSLPLRNLGTENFLSGFVSVDQNAIAGRNSRIGQHLEFHNSV
jgi:hypothetical protein